MYIEKSDNLDTKRGITVKKEEDRGVGGRVRRDRNNGRPPPTYAFSPH